MELGDRGAGLVEPRALGGELRARFAELPFGGARAIGELGARDLEPQRRLLERVRAPAAREQRGHDRPEDEAGGEHGEDDDELFRLHRSSIASAWLTRRA